MIEIINAEQNSPEWFAARCGIPTASQFATIMAKGKSGGESITRQKYLYRLAGEIITGKPEETYSNYNMQRGHEMEKEAVSYYEMLNGIDCETVGFVRNGRIGASPDRLVGDTGVLEIKTSIPSVLIGHILKDEFPPMYLAQTQGQLMVCEREFVDLCIYWPGMPSFIKREWRDETYITYMQNSIGVFIDELDSIVSKLRV